MGNWMDLQENFDFVSFTLWVEESQANLSLMQ